MYIQHNIKARSCNYCCHGKAVSVTSHECEAIFFHIFSAVLCCHLWGVWFYRTFSHSFIKGTICTRSPCQILIKLDFLYFLKILRYQIS